MGVEGCKEGWIIVVAVHGRRT